MTTKDYYIGFQNNDQRVITMFYEKFASKVKQQLRTKYSSLYLDEDFLADTYQDAIVRLWENIYCNKITYENLTSDITGYLYGIAENVLREQLRKQKEISLEDLPDLPADIAKFVSHFEISERNRAIRDLVNSMDKPCAPILLDFYWHGYSMEEIAKRLGYASADSAKTQKNKCMNKLKTIFKSEYHG